MVCMLISSPPATHAATSLFMPAPFAVGQWTRHKLVDDKGQPSFMTYKVIGQEGDGFWLEIVTEAYTGRTMLKMLLAIPNRTDPSSIDIRAVAMKDKSGRVTNFDGPLLSLMRSSYQSALTTLVINWQGLPQEDASVPAGTFAGCFKSRTDASWGPWHSASTSWSTGCRRKSFDSVLDITVIFSGGIGYLARR